MADNIKGKLEQHRKQLLSEMEQLQAMGPRVEIAFELREPRSDRGADAATALDLERKLALEDNLRSQLTLVDHALRKLEEGSYGRCDACGQIIPEERLQALPYANLCIKCKANQSRDVRVKRFGR